MINNNVPQHTGCPGSKERAFIKSDNKVKEEVSSSSELTHWPIQLHLANPNASHFHGCDLLLAADCVPFSISNFHSRFLKNKKLVIACPKLDSNKQAYSEKLRILIEESKINTLHVVIMEVPCCGALLQLAENAVASSDRKVPVKYSVVGVQGDVLEEEWL